MNLAVLAVVGPPLFGGTCYSSSRQRRRRRRIPGNFHGCRRCQHGRCRTHPCFPTRPTLYLSVSLLFPRNLTRAHRKGHTIRPRCFTAHPALYLPMVPRWPSTLLYHPRCPNTTMLLHFLPRRCLLHYYCITTTLQYHPPC